MFRRVPTIDQCYTDDPVCKYEANQQFKRDKLVENEILSILRYRFEDCVLYEAPDHLTKCQDILEVYKRAEENWFCKCKWSPLASCESRIETKTKIFYVLADGDLGYYGDAEAAYFKQKHRMVWERRHGKVGSGRKDVNNDEQGEH